MRHVTVFISEPDDFHLSGFTTQKKPSDCQRVQVSHVPCWRCVSVVSLSGSFVVIRSEKVFRRNKNLQKLMSEIGKNLSCWQFRALFVFKWWPGRNDAPGEKHSNRGILHGHFVGVFSSHTSPLDLNLHPVNLQKMESRSNHEEMSSCDCVLSHIAWQKFVSVLIVTAPSDRTTYESFYFDLETFHSPLLHFFFFFFFFYLI